MRAYKRPYGLFVMDISILFGRCQPTRTISPFILGDVTLKHRRGTVVQKSLACLENRSTVQWLYGSILRHFGGSSPQLESVYETVS